MPSKLSDTYPRIWDVVCAVPRGTVTTYGRVAVLAGRAGQARLVGYALHNLPPGADIPWHRVLNSQGKISLPGDSGARQRALLEKEGVRFSRGRVDLAEFGWRPARRARKSSPASRRRPHRQ
jgi:methylated-DNA-protein-cysteine methyltransferase-like protein